MYTKRNLVRGVSMQFYCSKTEQAYIRGCAKKSGLSMSAYLRRVAIQGFTSKEKSLPAEVLAFQGQLAHVGGQLEIIARKRLDGDELNALERADLKEVGSSIQEICKELKHHLL